MQSIIADLPEVEYLDGKPFPKVSPKRTHALIQLRLARILQDCAIDLGEVGTEWRFRISGDDAQTQFVPDVAFVSNERLAPLHEDALEEPPFAPDIAVEVRSPSDNVQFLKRKIARYLSAGAVLVLDVDPKTKSINAYTRDGMETFKIGETFAGATLRWLRFNVGDVFPKER